MYIWHTQICYLSCKLMLSVLKAGNCAQDLQLWLYMYTMYSTDPIQAVTSLAKFWPDLNCTARLPGTSRLINTVPGIGLK